MAEGAGPVGYLVTLDNTPELTLKASTSPSVFTPVGRAFWAATKTELPLASTFTPVGVKPTGTYVVVCVALLASIYVCVTGVQLPPPRLPDVGSTGKTTESPDQGWQKWRQGRLGFRVRKSQPRREMFPLC